MKIWKPLSKFRYSEERNEFKYHTDFSLKKSENIELKINGKTIIKEKPPKGKIYKIHFEMAIEIFEEKNNDCR